MSTTDRLVLFDTTLRDGEQSPGAAMTLAAKLRVAELLAAMGVDVIEAGFPISSPQQADALAGLLSGLRCKVNLIPINPDPVLGERMVPPDMDAVDAFHRRLKGHGLISTVRRPRGDDVAAACGQLRAYDRAPKGFAGRNLGKNFRGSG